MLGGSLKSANAISFLSRVMESNFALRSARGAVMGKYIDREEYVLVSAKRLAILVPNDVHCCYLEISIARTLETMRLTMKYNIYIIRSERYSP